MMSGQNSQGFDRFYFVTHSLIDAEMARESAAAASTGIQFWGSRSIAQRAAQSGLAQWLIDKAT